MIDKHVVITGGEGDLAAVITREFREAGYEVEAPARNDLDVSDKSSIRDFFQARQTGLLICNAGAIHDSLCARTTPADWDHVWSTNYTGAKLCAEAATHSMILHGEGHVLFISSHSALHPPIGQAAYATAKSALLGLTRDLATIHGPANIRVNAILPGFLDNRMTAHVSDARKGLVLQEHNLGRLNTMDCVASFIRFLHESMPHTSGQWFHLDSRSMQV